jgi:nicotinate-nucleotide adenylyltransferase
MSTHMTRVTSAPSRVGLLGGTFDPPHLGHLHAAAHAAWWCRLDVVRFVVANDPWQKSAVQPLTAAHHRLVMCELLVAGRPGLETSAVEIERGGPSYTIDTVEAEIGRGDVRVVLILGEDAAAGLDTWHRADELRELVEVAVVAREGAPPLPPGWRVHIVPAAPLDVSSTDLRARFRDGRPLEPLVPPEVVDYARRHRLYEE